MTDGEAQAAAIALLIGFSLGLIIGGLLVGGIWWLS